MNTKAYVAIFAVLIIVVSGGAAVLLTGDDSSDNKGPKISKTIYEIDPAKGWGSWNPVITNTPSSNMTGSAYIAQVADHWYNTIYGEAVPYGTYSISDVPADFMTYKSLVSHDASGNLVVKSTAKDASGEYTTKDVTFTEVPDVLICAASFASTVYTVIATAHDTRYTDYDDAVLDEFFGKMHAGDNGFINKFTKLYGVPTDKSTAVKMASCTSILKNKEAYLTEFGKLGDQGKTVCFMGMGSIGWDNGGDWLAEQTANIDSYSVLFDVTDMSAIFSNIEAISYILGYGDKAKEIIDSIRLDLYTISKAAEEKEKAYDYQRMAIYINVGENKARGADTLADELMTLFGFKNCCYDHTGNQTVNEEKIIERQPEILVFVSDVPPGDPSFDMDSALRIKKS